MRAFASMPIIALLCLAASVGGHDSSATAERTEPPTRVSVIADGITREVETSAGTVADVLRQLEIELNPLDRTAPSPGEAVLDGLAIRVTRVSRREVTTEETAPTHTLVLADPDLPAGFTKILRRGREGRVRRTVRTWERDGEVTLRAVIEEEVLKQAADTIVLRGTRGTPSCGGNWRDPLLMEATAYDPGPGCCGRFADGYTAIGIKAKRGVVAVDDRVISMGTRLYIPGYGFAVAGDRGSAIKGMRIDLCYPTRREALDFGRRRLKVYVLD